MTSVRSHLCGLLVLFGLVFPALPARAATSAPGHDSRADRTIAAAYTLLSTTFYRPISGSAIRTGADRAILAYARTRGITNPVVARSAPGLDYPAQILADANGVAKTYHLDRTETIYAALHGMAASTHDRWTEFFTPKEFASFDAPLDPKAIFGIGVLIDVDPKTKYARAFYVLPGGPADRANLVNGDLITAIGATSTKGLAQPQITKLLRGTPGTVVRIETQHPGGTRREIAIARGSVRPPTVFVRMLAHRVGYIAVAVFAQPTATEFSDALERLRKQNARAVVIDLRYDGGGYVFAAVAIASHFFESAPVVTSVTRDGVAVTQASDDADPQVTIPTAVLVNGYTASASEILAGALRDNHAATLFGTRTFGKGVEQTLSRLPGGAAIKITTARYLTPGNHDVNGRGIQPDVLVTLEPHAVLGDPARDRQLQTALQYLQSQADGRAGPAYGLTSIPSVFPSPST